MIFRQVKYYLATLFILLFHRNKSETDFFVQNLDGQCLECLCYAATNCDLTLDCIAGYCGPYKVSKLYWIDAGKVTLPEDDIERAGAFEDCARNYYCAQKMVRNYMAKFGKNVFKDCNGDGVTNCNDYSLINFNGGYSCAQDLLRNEAGRNWTVRYEACARWIT